MRYFVLTALCVATLLFALPYATACLTDSQCPDGYTCHNPDNTFQPPGECIRESSGGSGGGGTGGGGTGGVCEPGAPCDFAQCVGDRLYQPHCSDDGGVCQVQSGNADFTDCQYGCIVVSGGLDRCASCSLDSHCGSPSTTCLDSNTVRTTTPTCTGDGLCTTTTSDTSCASDEVCEGGVCVPDDPDPIN